MQYLRVKNWESFQHYKDRSPPWIKLHRDLLRDYHFLRLQDASKMQLMLIWLLASQLDNKIPADPEYIKTQIGIKGELNLNELIDNGFLVDDSNTLADCKQSAIGETEAETYSTDREETDILVETVVSLPKQKRVVEFRLDQWMANQGIDDIPKEWGDYAHDKLGMTVSEINLQWDKFVDCWKSKGGAKGKKADWAATWRNWCRTSIEYKQQRN